MDARELDIALDLLGANAGLLNDPVGLLPVAVKCLRQLAPVGPARVGRGDEGADLHEIAFLRRPLDQSSRWASRRTRRSTNPNPAEKTSSSEMK